MKKISAAAALLAVLLLAGCKRSGVEHIGQVLDDWRYEPAGHEAISAEPSDITPAENGDFSAVLGFRLSGQPAAGGLTQTASWAIDWFGQAEYQTSVDGSAHNPWTLVVRVAPEAGFALASTYNELHAATDEDVTAGGVEVRARTDTSGCALYTWKRDGFQFSLHSNELQGEVPDDLLDAMVEGLRAEDTSGAASGSGSESD